MKNKTIIWLNNPLLGICPEIIIIEKRHVPQCSLQHNLHSQGMEATKMSIDRCMDKEVVEHIHNGILLSPQKDQTQVSLTEVDESRAFDTDWTKSERDKQISYTSAYIWNLGKWYWWTFLQGRNRYTDAEERLVCLAMVGQGMTNWENSRET